MTAQEWAGKAYPEDQLCRVESDGGGYMIELNGGHEVLNRQVTYYWDDVAAGYFSVPSRRRVRDKIMTKFGGKRTAGADAKAKSAVVQEVEYVYRFDALATFIGAEAVFTDGAGTLDRVAFNEHITGDQMAMTVALSGYYPQAEAIKSRLNGLAS